MQEFMAAALEEARRGIAEGGIPIGAVLVHQGRIIGRGHNRRVQTGSVVLHAEMDADTGGHRPVLLHRFLLCAAPGNAGLRPGFASRVRGADPLRHR